MSAQTCLGSPSWDVVFGETQPWKDHGLSSSSKEAALRPNPDKGVSQLMKFLTFV